MRTTPWASLVAIGVAVAVACGDGPTESLFVPDAGDAGLDGTVSPLDPDGSFADDALPDLDALALTITPLDAVVDVTTGTALPTLQYEAFLSGTKVAAGWSIDRGEIGAISPSGALFTPTGTLGGKANITASYLGKKITTSVTVTLHVTQNGSPSSGDAGADAGGAGGNGGVGGEGPGAAVSGATQAVLLGATTADPVIKWLYPYDKTVWPRGILAPLLQWIPGAPGDYDAVYIHIAEKAYDYKGFFAKTAAPFVHHPIPNSVWHQLAYSNAGEDVTISVVLASGGTAYGPITETWKIAQGSLKGTVYYNSYGTRLAKNYTGAMGGDGKFGGATLAIKGGSTDPVLVAGGNGDASFCRVCHSVAANGASLVTQRGEASQQKFSAYDLKSGAETLLSPEGDGRYAWPAIFPDGTFFFSDSSPMPGSSALASSLYTIPTGVGPLPGNPIASTGLVASFRAACPSFSPDGKHVAFNFFGGTGSDGKTLATMTFDNGTKAFGAIVPLNTPGGGHAAVWPSFFPTNDAVIFEVETRYNTRDFGGTRSDADVAPPDPNADQGAHGELWWVDLGSKTATRLDKLNGAGYLPTGPNAHGDDSTLNYEPTVSPVPSGGYAWVVFTTRRLYGNIATSNPFYSDPRFHDLTQTATTKKLWVAAIDLNAAPGTDPSHPAFYLPGQELLAGNARGYWVVDPCHSDGTTCETGDECCGGFCQPGDGGFVCTAQQPACAQEFEKCNTAADCCGAPSVQCVNGRCAIPGPR